MPDWFERYLKSLTAEDADELWNWLDSEPRAVDAVLETLEVGA